VSVEALQETFAQDAAKLIQKAAELGYAVTLGPAYREPAQAAADAAAGSGIANSLHSERLAIDLNIFRAGVWLEDGADYADLGEWWCSLGPDHCWGQNFKGRKDGNHWSISPDGGKTQ
jgi:hypothetical protein